MELGTSGMVATAWAAVSTGISPTTPGQTAEAAEDAGAVAVAGAVAAVAAAEDRPLASSRADFSTWLLLGFNFLGNTGVFH